MEDICNFIPPKKYNNNLEFFHFVYETNIKKLRQPFSYTNFYLNIVFKGTAVIKYNNKSASLQSGDIFFTFPYQSFTLDADDKFTYLYISFNGEDASLLLNSFNINEDNCIYRKFNSILPFWMDSVRCVNHDNANVLTESVLKYTLSFISSTNMTTAPERDKFDIILEYINHNYTSKDISISKIADIFFYSEKYMSMLFSKKTGIKFSMYLNKLRIEYAKNLFDNGKISISEVADKCGYTDQFYFSKVFKRLVQKTPSQYIKSLCN